MQSNDPNLVAQTHIPGAGVGAGVGAQGHVAQPGLAQGGLVQGGLNQGGLVHGGLVQDANLVQGGLHQGGLVQGGLGQGGLVQGGLGQGGLGQGGLVQGGLVQDSNLTHTHHAHSHHSHTHHTHGEQVLIQQTGVPTTGMTLVSTQVGQTVQVGQPHLVGGEQIYTTVPGVVTGTGLGTGVGTGVGLGTGVGTHHHHTGLAPAVGTGLAAGAGTAALVNHNLGNDYKGTFVFRPLEGRFTKDKDLVGKMDPYVKIKIGWHSGKSSVAKSEGVNPVWGDVIPLEKKHHEEFAKLKVKDKDRASLNDKLGETKIPLADIAARGRVNQWFPVYKKEVQTGEILLDIAFEPLTKVL